ncbi:MAG: ATP-dependent helicase [Cyanobacteria bacterium P01_H01_bin.74]
MTPQTEIQTKKQPQAERPLFNFAHLNPSQREAVFASKEMPVKVLAGAGTGKTELIACRFVKLASDFAAEGLTPPETRLLVLTFTNDAAANMKDRIKAYLNKDNFSSDVENQTLWIATFHQVCQQILRGHAHEVGLGPEFTLVDKIALESIAERVINAVEIGDETLTQRWFLRNKNSSIPETALDLTLLKTLDIKILRDLLDPHMLLDLIGRIKSTGLSPDAFYQTATAQAVTLTDALLKTPQPGLTPEKKAGTEKIKAVDAIVAAFNLWKEHFSGWADSDWDPLAEASQQAENSGATLTASGLKKMLPEMVSFFLTPRTFLPQWPGLLPAESVEVREIQEFLNLEQRLIQVIAALYAMVQDVLLSENACDFDDLINHCITLFSNNQALRARYQTWFKAIIVDEFQDSNTSQLKLLQLLMAPQAANMTVVGDDKQSIYGFRFAQPENLDLIFETAPAVKTVNLTLNYRSVPQILDLANAVSMHINPKNHQALQSGRAADLNPNFRKQAPVTWIDVGDTSPELENRSATTQDYQNAESAAIIQAIQAMVSKNTDNGFSLSNGSPGSKTECELSSQNADFQHSDFQYGDIAILVQSHAKAERLFNALTAEKIPAVRQKSLDFFAEPIVKDAMAILQLLSNTSHLGSWARLLQKKLSHHQLHVLLEAYRNWQKEKQSDPCNPLAPPATDKNKERTFIGFLMQLDTSGDESSPDNGLLKPIPTVYRFAMQSLAIQLKTIIGNAHSTNPGDVVDQVARLTGILSNGQIPTFHQQQVQHTWQTFLALLAHCHYRMNKRKSYLALLNAVLAYARHPEEKLPVTVKISDGSAVKIMTTYAAKGLEFPVVFLANAEKPLKKGSTDRITFEPQNQLKNGFGLILASYNAQKNLKKELLQKLWQAKQAHKERLRLFYVAVTRAQKHLYIVTSPDSADYSKESYYSPV